MGVDSTNNWGYIQSVKPKVAYNTLLLNPMGGDVQIRNARISHPSFPTNPNYWTLRQSSDGKLCFALNGSDKMCFNSSGSLVLPTAPF
jgi:hypothetical protein